jgi:hypothetical protein
MVEDVLPPEKRGKVSTTQVKDELNVEPKYKGNIALKFYKEILNSEYEKVLVHFPLFHYLFYYLQLNTHGT